MFDPRDFTSDPRTPEARPKDRRTDEQIKTDAWRKSEEIRDYYKSAEYHADRRSQFVERRAARHAKERENRERNGHRREYDPCKTKRQTFQDRTDRAIAGTWESTATSPTVT